MVRAATTREDLVSPAQRRPDGPVPPEAQPISALALSRPRVRRRASPILLVARWFAADIHATLAVALAVPVLVVEAAHGFVGAGPALALTAAYLALQVGLGVAVGRARRGARGIARLVLAEKLRSTIARIAVAGVEQPLSGSFGVATFPDDATDPASLLRSADRALYRAKSNGKNRVEVAAVVDDDPDELALVTAEDEPVEARTAKPAKADTRRR